MTKRTGWAIGAGIALVIVSCGIIWLLRGGGLGEPSGAIVGKMGLITYTPDLSALVTVPKGRGADVYYDQAVHRALAMGTATEFTMRTLQALEPEKDTDLAAIISDLKDGAGEGMGDDEVLAFADLASDGPHEKKVTAFLTALAALPGDAAFSYALDRKFDEAIASANAGLVFSERMWSRGPSWAQRQAGLEGMGSALAQLKGIYARMGNKEKVEAVNHVEGERLATLKVWEAKSKLAFRHSPLALRPADLLYMATHDADKVWRLEGVKWLGVARYSGATEQTRAVIDVELERLMESKDEELAATARRARELTGEDVQAMLRE